MSITAINTVQIHAAQDQSETVGRKLEVIVGALRDIPGCLSYGVSRSQLNHALWIVCGHWQSTTLMEAHFSHPALAEFNTLMDCNIVSSFDFKTFLPLNPDGPAS